MIILAALSRTETIKKGFQMTGIWTANRDKLRAGNIFKSSSTSTQSTTEAPEVLAEIVTRPKLAPLTVELPTQAKYKEEDNSNVEIKLEGDPEEKVKEFAVMYSHYGPIKKLYFSVFMTKTVH